MRWSVYGVTAIVLGCVLIAGPARAGDDEPQRREAVLHGIGQGIEALRALGGQDELVARLKEIHARLREEGAGRDGRRPEGAGAERAIVKRWLGLMRMAKDVLADTDAREMMEILEHGMHALELALEGRGDPEARRIRARAPPRARQAEALARAAELLAERGKRDGAQALAELAARFREDKERGEEGAGEKAAERAGLAQRLDILRLAVRILQERERGDAVDLLRRAIHSGELMMQGREDDEARRIIERTPPLPELARVLHMASELWMEAGHESKAAALERLARYYGQRAEGHDVAWGAEPDAERPADRPAPEREHLEALHHKMVELQKQLEQIQRQLRALSGEK